MGNEGVWTGEDLWQKQREAEARVQRMREENRRLANRAEACVPSKPPSESAPCHREDIGRWLPLLLALVIAKEGGSTLLVLALVYLTL